MKKILAVTLVLVMLMACAVFASAEEELNLTGMLKYADADFWPATTGDCPFTVTGPGTYTITLENITATYGAGLDNAYMLYIEVEGGYQYLKDYTVSDVSIVVDGEAIEVNQEYVWTYESLGTDYLPNGNYCIELYNGLGYSGAGYGAAIDPAIFADESIVITFTLNAPVEPPVADGDNVKIYFPAGESYITATANDAGKKLLEGSAAEAAVWTVEVDENGYYSFIVDGKYLTSGATGNQLTLEDAPSELSLWTLVEAENGWYIQSVNAAYNGNPQYLEYYSGFTTYGMSATSNVANYTFQFEVVENTTPAPNPGTGDLIFIALSVLAVSGMGLTAVVTKK